MDKAQAFIKECLLTRNFTNPNKPIDENRLQSTLLLLPTDGALSSRLKKDRSQLKINKETLENGSSVLVYHSIYKEMNKNSRTALHGYIVGSRKAICEAKLIAKKNKLTNRESLLKFLTDNKFDLASKLPNYTKLIPMHEELWLGYMKELLNLPQVVTNSEKLSINGSTTLLKLSMADYNGALLKVTKSKNKNLVGIEGIVVWESQKSFVMITKGFLVDELKIIPKKGTVFGFQIPINQDDALQYSILGDRFKYRSVDRAGKKFKSRHCDDMLYYIYKG